MSKLGFLLEGNVTSGEQSVTGAVVRLIGSVHTLSADPRAVIYAPSVVAWSRIITGFEGNTWTAWQKYVSRDVAGLTYQEFKTEVTEYNPSLAESGGRFQSTETYAMPSSGSTSYAPDSDPPVVWDRRLTGFSGDRWACWRQYVQGKVVGLTWAAFRAEVGQQNVQLIGASNEFKASQTYVLPRNAGQHSYTRVAYTDSLGTYQFVDLPPGYYDVEVRAAGYRPLSTRVEVDGDTTLHLELDSDAAWDLELEALDFALETPGPWVRTRPKDMRFFVQGQVFRFVGVNLRAIVHYGTPSFNPAAEKKDRRIQLDKAREVGARVVRFFLPVKDATTEQVGNRFEELLNLVRQDFSEMYLLPALTDLYDNTPFHPLGDDEFYQVQPDNWKILGKKWYTEGYLVNYLPFVEYIVKRFKGEPQILAWEIGNELKTPHGGRPRDFIDFNLSVAHRIRALDPGQLITTGLLSTCHSGIFDPGKERLYGSEDIDFVTNHIYDFGRKEDPNDHCLHKHDRFWAEKAGKPWLIEEAGFESQSPDEDRGPIVAEDMNRWFGLGASGYMQWAFMGGGKNNGDGDWRHGMDDQAAWHQDWKSLAAVYKRRADSLRAQ